MLIEQWKEIRGNKNHYQVSNFGRIKSCAWGRDRILAACKMGKYLKIKLCGNCKFAIHRLVASYFIENPENKNEVNHIDGNKLNNHMDNLEWTTSSENMKHAYKTGLHKKPMGEENPISKLTNFQVRRIRLMRTILPVISYQKIAEMFNVTAALICRIIKRQAWQHI